VAVKIWLVLALVAIATPIGLLALLDHGGFVALWYPLLLIPAFCGAGWDRRLGSVGVLGAGMGGLVGGVFLTMVDFAFDPVTPGYLGPYLLLVFAFLGWVAGTLLGGVLWPCVALCRILSRAGDSARQAALAWWLRAGTVTAVVTLGFALSISVGEWMNLDVRPHRRPSLTLRGHNDAVQALAFSPDSKLLVSGGRDGRVQAWDVTTGQRRWTRALLQTEGVGAVAFAPDGRSLAWGGKTVELCDPATGDTDTRLVGHRGEVQRLAFSPHGRTLASASDCAPESPAEVKLWDLATRRELATTIRGGTVNALTFSADGKQLVVLLNSAHILVFDAPSLAEPAVLPEPYPRVCTAAMAPDGRSLAVGGRVSDREPGMIGFWDTATWQRRRELSGHGLAVLGLAFTPDGTGLASVSAPDKAVWLWDLARGQRKLLLKGLSYPQGCLAISADGTRLAAGDRNGTVCVWDLSANER
jgi:hypothetical protein